MESKEKSRNSTVDILRGIAMLMVVFGHTMTGCTKYSEDSFLFNIVWTLQMPLFILISGYVTKYSKPINSIKALGKFIKKRTLAYLLPWTIWIFVIRGMIFQQSNYLDIKYVVYHMDAGYWFLFTIWTIVIVFGIAQLISEKLCHRKNKYFKMIALAIAYVLGMSVLGGIGLIMGLSFLGIKLTLYYMPFYFAGYLFGQIQPNMEHLKFGQRIIDSCIAICLVVWIALMKRYNFYAIGESEFGIIIRAFASLSGCIAVCGLIAQLTNNSSGGGTRTICRCPFIGNLLSTLPDSINDKADSVADIQYTTRDFTNSAELCTDSRSGDSGNYIVKSEQNNKSYSIWKAFLIWIGQHSLEVYVLHGFTLNLLKTTIMPKFDSFVGIGLALLNYCLTIILTCAITLLIVQNGIINFCVFGKQNIRRNK